MVGDPTSSGGWVVTGSPFTDIDGHPVARIGDRATCPRHKGAFAIVSGDMRLIVDGQPAAREGDRLACGCTLHSARQRRVFIDQGGLGGSATVLGAVPAATPVATPADAASTQLDAAATAPAPATVTLRIGVFFDGTNNNAGNVALGQQCRASSADALGQDAQDQAAIAEHCRPYMLRDGSSYDNGVSNVARLFRLYEDSTIRPFEPGMKEYCVRIYVEGIGTMSGEQDSLLSQGLGGGKTGVIARVEQALQELIPGQIETFVANAPDVQVSAVEFDVFGFSRGATAARHFIHQVNRKGHGPLGQALLNRGVRYAGGFEFVKGVQVGFVGLFDTVAAIGSLADGLDVRDGREGGVQLALPAGCARQVVQLAARDERRANFLLTSVAPPHREIALPGAHSDIGGGYHREREGPLLLGKPQGYEELPDGLAPGQAPTVAQMQRSRAYVQAEAECRRWRDHLGLGPEEVRVSAWHRWQAIRRAGSPSVQPQWTLRVYAAVVLERPIDWRYQLIPLRVMHGLASEAGVSWEQSPNEVPDYSLPEELAPIAEKLMAGTALNQEEEALLRRRYLHQSAHWNFALGDRLGGGPVSLDLVYVNRPDPSGKRGIKPNQ